MTTEAFLVNVAIGSALGLIFAVREQMQRARHRRQTLEVLEAAEHTVAAMQFRLQVMALQPRAVIGECRECKVRMVAASVPFIMPGTHN